MKSDTPTVVSYASRGLDADILNTIRARFRTAVICALLPLTTGIAITLAYWVTLSAPLPIIGCFLLPVGFCCFLVGIAKISYCIISHFKAKELQLRPPLNPFLLLLTVIALFANLPTAAICAFAGESMRGTAYVDVINETGAPIDHCVVWVTGTAQETRHLPNGARFRAAIWSGVEGRGSVTVTQGGRTEEIMVFHHEDAEWETVRLGPGLTGR